MQNNAGKTELWRAGYLLTDRQSISERHLWMTDSDTRGFGASNPRLKRGSAKLNYFKGPSAIQLNEIGGKDFQMTTHSCVYLVSPVNIMNTELCPPARRIPRAFAPRCSRFLS